MTRQELAEKLNILEFTPLEFETQLGFYFLLACSRLEFTPLEFETTTKFTYLWSGRWLEFTPLEFETIV